MVGKHSHENDGQKNIGNLVELGYDEEDKLLGDDDEINHSPRTKPAASEKTNDTPGATLLQLNDNTLSVTKSMSTMQKTLEQFADGQRHSKRPRINELSDIDTN